MAIRCEFIDFIIPIENIDKVYSGGFAKYKEDNSELFSLRLWNDEFLLRDGAMNPADIEQLIRKWEGLGLQGIVEKNGERCWKDFCVVEGMAGGSTLKCDWIEYDKNDNCISLKGTPKGDIIGRINDLHR